MVVGAADSPGAGAACYCYCYPLRQGLLEVFSRTCCILLLFDTRCYVDRIPNISACLAVHELATCSCGGFPQAIIGVTHKVK